MADNDNKVRRTVGSVIKSKDPKSPDYIKFNEDVVFRKGDTLSLESSAYQISSLQSALSAGKLSAEYVEKQIERVGNTPEWVRFHIVGKVPRRD